MGRHFINIGWWRGHRGPPWAWSGLWSPSSVGYPRSPDGLHLLMRPAIELMTAATHCTTGDDDHVHQVHTILITTGKVVRENTAWRGVNLFFPRSARLGFFFFYDIAYCRVHTLCASRRSDTPSNKPPKLYTYIYIKNYCNNGSCTMASDSPILPLPDDCWRRGDGFNRKGKNACIY